MAARIMPGLGIRAGYTSGESGWGTALNEDLLLLSAAVQLSVKSKTTHLPGTGSAGDIYIVPVGDTDEGLIAVWDNGDWEMIPANRGWLAYVVDVGKHHMFNDTDWEVFKDLIGLPPYSIADDGKILSVDDTGIAKWVTPSGGGGVAELPAYTVAEDGKILAVNAAGILEWVTPSGGGVAELPAYTVAEDGKVLAVNAAGMLEWVTPVSGGASAFTGLSDTPADYTGAALKSARVNAAETALEFYTPTPAFNTNTKTANYTSVSADFAGNRLIGMDLAGANTFTVDAGMTNGEPVAITQLGAGQTSIVAAAGVTIVSAGGALKLRTRYSTCTVMKLATNSYLVVGDIVI